MRIVVHKLKFFDPDDPIAKGLAADIIASVTDACEKQLFSTKEQGAELIARIRHGSMSMPFDFIIELSSCGADDDAGRDWYIRRFEEAEYNNELFESKVIAPSYLKYGGGVREVHQALSVEARYQHGEEDANKFLKGFLMNKDQIRSDSEHAIAVICSAIRDACD